MDLSTKFVQKQGGVWDHTAWLEFISEVQKKGFAISNDMQSNIGKFIESLKNIHNSMTSTSGIEKVMLGITDNITSFIKNNKGNWDHSAWEELVKDIQKKGVDLSDESKSYLGNVVEAAKGLYTLPGSEAKQ
ncbi:hypothetical protein MCHI_000583 [Candidatus Magnetoovum chiemensis]|nr:hypothetical protein MCHI_000583 [Candidatus Magnetoovum chiemensis]